jgi:hypothetical protein
VTDKRILKVDYVLKIHLSSDEEKLHLEITNSIVFDTNVQPFRKIDEL